VLSPKPAGGASKRWSGAAERVRRARLGQNLRFGPIVLLSLSRPFVGGRLLVSVTFLFVSLVTGMSCQVSNVQITSRAMPRVTLLQIAPSFFFNTVILALALASSPDRLSPHFLHGHAAHSVQEIRAGARAHFFALHRAHHEEGAGILPLFTFRK
jgi:hypothetical protein